MLVRRLGFAAAAAVLVIGPVASAYVFHLASAVETERARNALRTEVEFRTKAIEHRLHDGLIPVAAVAVLAGSQTHLSDADFQALSSRAGTLGIPIGRLGWEPRVPGDQREEFERQARSAGNPGYQITDLTRDGTFVPAARRDEYFPFRLESLRGTYPTNKGFDIGSDPLRHRIMETARDLGQPVAIRPAIRQRGLQGTPTYAIYWPLFSGDVPPTTVEARRLRLSGYVTALVSISDALEYAFQDMRDISVPIIFTATNGVAGEPQQLVASYIPGHGIVVGERGAIAADPTAIVVRRDFTLLQQQWTIEFRFPATSVARLQTNTPAMSAGLGGLATAALAGCLLLVVRRTERDRKQRAVMMDMMRTQEHTNAKLAEANRQLAQRERATAEMAHARTRFLAVASHDLRQPLHALALFTSALQRRVSDAVGLELVGNIRELTLSMQRMFASLLDLSRLDAGAVLAHKRPFEAEGLVATLFKEFSAEAEAKGVSLRRAGRFPCVDTDPVLLEGVLRNLLGNAIKFTDRGAILIAGRPRANTLGIEIWDTGCGIAADQTERIFDEFERLGSNKPGFGLGLPIVRQMCLLIGAEVSVCSRQGRGSRFAVQLPRAATGARNVPGGSAPSDVPLEGLRVLVVDNDGDVQRALSLELEDLGCIVQAASNQAEALSHMRGQDAPELVILDLQFDAGQPDGWAIADQLRGIWPTVKIILLTGTTDAATLERIHNSGLPAMFKPVEPERLAHAMGDLVGRAAGPG